VHPTYITRLEAGEFVSPSLVRLTAIATALGRRVVEFTEPPADPLDADLLEQIHELTGTDDGLLSEIVAEVMRYPADQRSAALRFTLQSLRLIKIAPLPTQ
jgi:transcriptional regulator with XRE-family HTH domain